jgi:rubrerythrin
MPFANGDAINGFKYEGEELTPKKYVKMEEDEYYGHCNTVDEMVISSLGNNMSYNPYEKRVINVKNQSYVFHLCDGNIRNINGSDITVTQLERLWINKEQFGLYIYLDNEQFSKKPDFETDLKMWIQDSQKIMNINGMPEEYKLLHLPKKDFKIDFNDGKSHAVLKNCKFAKLLSSIRKPVTRLCNVCGYRNENKGKITEWICPECGKLHQGEPMITSFAIIVERIVFTKK